MKSSVLWNELMYLSLTYIQRADRWFIEYIVIPNR